MCLNTIYTAYNTLNKCIGHMKFCNIAFRKCIIAYKNLRKGGCPLIFRIQTGFLFTFHSHHSWHSDGVFPPIHMKQVLRLVSLTCASPLRYLFTWVYNMTYIYFIEGLYVSLLHVYGSLI